MTRPGRLDRIIYVGLPSKAGRAEVLRIHTRNMSVDPQLDIDELAVFVRSFARTILLILKY